MNDQVERSIVFEMPSHFSGKAVKETIASVRMALNKGVTTLTFNFIKVESIDSFGIGQLVSLAKELKERNAHLALSNLNDDLFQLFRDTGLDQIFAIEGVKQDVIDLFASSVDVRLDIKIEEKSDVCIFNMSGVMDNIGGSRFFRQKLLLSLARFRKILLDLSELTFFDSLSVGVLLDMDKLLKETGGQMRICGANYIIEDLFATLNLSAVIPIYPTQEEALTEWN